MKKFIYILAVMICTAQLASAQKMTFSPILREDDRNMNFEIIGKVGDNFHIFKQVRYKFLLEVLDNNMEILKNDRLDFLPERTINVDFVPYSYYYWMIYQFQKNAIVYCNAAQIDGAGNLVGQPITLDTTNIGVFNSNKIYNTTFSEDKSQVLIYKLYKKGSKINVVAKRFGPTMVGVDSARFSFEADQNDDEFSDFQISNKGTIVFGRHLRKGFRDYIDNFTMYTKQPGDTEFKTVNIPIEKNHYIDVVQIKPDNANNQFIANAFYYPEKNGNIRGLFSAVYNPADKIVKTGFINFSDSVRAKFSNDGSMRTAFDDLALRNVYVRKDGSFMLISEDFSSYTSGGLNPWNRYGYYPYGGSYMYDYYMFNRYNYNYYRPYGYGSSNQRTRYNYDNLLIMSVDTAMRPEWEQIIYKKQADDETDNFMSYAVMNSGNEIYMLFRLQDRRDYVIGNQSITPGGTINRYPTLKSMSTKYDFMPRMAKQVGLRQIIIPAMYRGRIVFAKADFS